MARVVKTDYASRGYKHRDHTSKKTRRKDHRRRREQKIMLLELEEKNQKRTIKFKNNQIENE